MSRVVEFSEASRTELIISARISAGENHCANRELADAMKYYARAGFCTLRSIDCGRDNYVHFSVVGEK
jgi:hypothetical protein